MSYKPMTADEAAKLNLRPDGVYGFEVAEAKAATSKEKQSPMIALVLNVFDTDGSRFSVKDWLVHSDSRWAEKKVFDFSNTTGLQAKYSAGAMTAEDCLGRSGFVFIGTEKGKPKSDGSGSFPDRNQVKYYTTKKPDAADAPKSQPTATSKTTDEDLNDSIPF